MPEALTLRQHLTALLKSDYDESDENAQGGVFSVEDNAYGIVDRILNDLSQFISELPEMSAAKSRDFGRGYSLAIKDVLDALNE